MDDEYSSSTEESDCSDAEDSVLSKTSPTINPTNSNQTTKQPSTLPHQNISQTFWQMPSDSNMNVKMITQPYLIPCSEGLVSPDSNKRHSSASLDSSRDSTYATGSESSNGVSYIAL